MLDETPDLLNQNIIIILRNWQFFADLEELNKILAPIKKACTILESKNTTLKVEYVISSDQKISVQEPIKLLDF